MAVPPVSLEHHDGVAEIVLATPDRGNAIDLAWTAALRTAVDGLGEADRCVLVRAEGRNFCVGGDVTTFAGDDPGAGIRALAEDLHRGLLALDATGLPIVAAVQGWATGAGMSLALAADLLVIGHGTRFKTAYNALGLTADGGMTWHLPRRVPSAVATDLLLTDRVLVAEEAHQLGLASRVVDDTNLLDEARGVATDIAGRSRPASAAVLALLAASPRAALAEQLAAEADAIAVAADGVEGREGVAAFLERRPADFP